MSLYAYISYVVTNKIQFVTQMEIVLYYDRNIILMRDLLCSRLDLRV